MIYEIYSEKKQTEASGFPSGNQNVCFPFTHPGLTDTLRVPVWAWFDGHSEPSDQRRCQMAMMLFSGNVVERAPLPTAVH